MKLATAKIHIIWLKYHRQWRKSANKQTNNQTNKQTTKQTNYYFLSIYQVYVEKKIADLLASVETLSSHIAKKRDRYLRRRRRRDVDKYTIKDSIDVENKNVGELFNMKGFTDS